MDDAGAVSRGAINAWVEGYLAAWDSNDPVQIAALFTEDARYFDAPDREPWRGPEAIVAGWLGAEDKPGTWEFRHEILAIAGDLGFVRGWTRYIAPAEPKTYSNLWVVRLAPDGRCSEFTEWWMEQD